MLQHMKLIFAFEKSNPAQSMLSKHQFQIAKNTRFPNSAGISKLESCLREPSQGYQTAVPEDMSIHFILYHSISSYIYIFLNSPNWPTNTTSLSQNENSQRLQWKKCDSFLAHCMLHAEPHLYRYKHNQK